MSNAITKKEEFLKLEAHEHAAIFPMMAEKDFANLKEDIKANGLLEPIILFEDKILDGRNRHKACCELLNDKDLTYAVIKNKIKEFDGEDSTEYVISTNLFRRQLNESQRALVGAKILPHFQKKTKENQEDQESSRANLHSGRSDGWAAKCVNVSARSVASAKAILDKDIPLLNDLVESGLMKVSTGETFCSHGDCKKLIDDAHKSILKHWEAKRQKKLSELGKPSR